MACRNRSKISIGLTSVPFLSIISFSIRCGIGTKGAKPNATAKIASAPYGIESSIAISRYPPNNVSTSIRAESFVYETDEGLLGDGAHDLIHHLAFIEKDEGRDAAYAVPGGNLGRRFRVQLD